MAKEAHMNTKKLLPRTMSLIALAALMTTGLCCRIGARDEKAKGGISAPPGAAAAANIPEKDIFTCTSAGRWYPEGQAELEKMMDAWLAKAQPAKLKGRIVAVIAPHAGYIYSGPVAAYAYRQLEGLKFDTVAVVGFNHGTRGEGIATYRTGGFRTPLGVIPIDEKSVTALEAASPLIKHNPAAFSGEHSLDNQLPFLQRTLGDFKLVPLLLTDQSQENIDALAAAMAKVFKGKNVLLVASTDMSHFWQHEEAKQLDDDVLKKILALDPAGLNKLLAGDPTGRRLCGRGDVEAVMRAAKTLGADKATLLKYADSEDTFGPTGNGVVGYGAVAITASKAKNTKRTDAAPRLHKNDSFGGELDKKDQQRLLQIARESLEEFIKTGNSKEFANKLPRLNEKRGVFVTLNKNGDLRGCMGHFENDTPLYKIVASQTLVSAVQDPRFNPVTANELKDITIEISVLSVPKPVDSYEDIVVGKHGVILRKGMAGATFLPQVAPEQGWSRDEMLSNLSRKAGLAADAWKSGASFMVYTAQVFGETGK